MHPIVEGLERPVSLYRTCYRRSDRKWRARDERKDWEAEGAMIAVNDVVGDFHVEWRLTDRVAHIFHQGWQVIDEAGVAHLYDPELNYG